MKLINVCLLIALAATITPQTQPNQTMLYTAGLLCGSGAALCAASFFWAQRKIKALDALGGHEREKPETKKTLAQWKTVRNVCGTIGAQLASLSIGYLYGNYISRVDRKGKAGLLYGSGAALLCVASYLWADRKVKALNALSNYEKNKPETERALVQWKAVRDVCAMISMPLASLPILGLHFDYQYARKRRAMEERHAMENRQAMEARRAMEERHARENRHAMEARRDMMEERHARENHHAMAG